MILIIDTNILFAALLKESTTRRFLIDSPFMLYAPETLVTEIHKYEDEIVRRSGLSKKDFEQLFALITENIVIRKQESYQDKMDEAEQLIGHLDKGDVPFIALALSIRNDGIWTENVNHFKQQNKIRVWTTRDIISQIGEF